MTGPPGRALLCRPTMMTARSGQWLCVVQLARVKRVPLDTRTGAACRLLPRPDCPARSHRDRIGAGSSRPLPHHRTCGQVHDETCQQGFWCHTPGHERQGLWPLARPGSYAPPMNGGEIRDTRFLRGFGWGYDVSEVDELLRRVAAELDADRPVRSLIENAAFRIRAYSRGCDVDAVDWFLDRLLHCPGHVELAGMNADPWPDLGAVTQVTQSRTADAVVRSGRVREGVSSKEFAEQCANAWRGFGQLPGTHLRWEHVGRGRSELRTAEQQTIASVRGSRRSTTVSAGGRNFAVQDYAWERTRVRDMAELAARSSADYIGHFAKGAPGWYIRAETEYKKRTSRTQPVGEVVDETGTPVLFISGKNYARRACARISFPDQRWLRFPVRGTESENAVMTMVDQAGATIARYRIVKEGFSRGHSTVEITVRPDRELTDELVVAITESAGSLYSYFAWPDHWWSGQ